MSVVKHLKRGAKEGRSSDRLQVENAGCAEVAPACCVKDVTFSGEVREQPVALQSQEDPPAGVKREWTPQALRAVRKHPAYPGDSSTHTVPFRVCVCVFSCVFYITGAVCSVVAG